MGRCLTNCKNQTVCKNVTKAVFIVLIFKIYMMYLGVKSIYIKNINILIFILRLNMSSQKLTEINKKRCFINFVKKRSNVTQKKAVIKQLSFMTTS